MATSRAVSPAGIPWRRRLTSVFDDEPLIMRAASEAALLESDALRAPRTVYLGIGLCGRSGLSQSIPFDLLGMLLPAERVRSALGADLLVALVADVHAAENHHAPVAIERRARRMVWTLGRIKHRLGLERLTVVRAKCLHRMPRYREAFDRIRRRAPEWHPYILRQIADVAVLDDLFGGLLKFGWSLSKRRAASPLDRADETGFDALVRPITGKSIPCVYSVPGRALDDRARKASPYVAVRPQRRMCLDPAENVEDKLARAEQELRASTLQGVQIHLGRVIRAYDRVVDPISGSIEGRMRNVVHRIYGDPGR